MAYLFITRPLNLLLIALVQCLIKFTVFDTIGLETALSNVQFFMLVAATLLIAASGNVINDIFDQEIDQVNRPGKRLVGKRISESSAYNYYFILTIAGVLAGFLLANQIDRPGLAAIFITIAALLYLYASQFKSILLLGNILVSAIVASSLLVIIIFEIYPMIVQTMVPDQLKVSKLIFHYSIFALVINLIREIVKDIEDINGDMKGGIQSLAIVLGRNRAVYISLVVTVFMIFGLLFYMYQYFYHSQLMVVYTLLLIIAPLIYFCILAWSAENQKHYKRMSGILKITMLTGICSIPIAAKTIL